MKLASFSESMVDIEAQCVIGPLNILSLWFRIPLEVYQLLPKADNPHKYMNQDTFRDHDGKVSVSEKTARVDSFEANFKTQKNQKNTSSRNRRSAIFRI